MRILFIALVSLIVPLVFGCQDKAAPAPKQEAPAKQAQAPDKPAEAAGQAAPSNAKTETKAPPAEEMVVQALEAFAASVRAPASWERRDIGPKAVSFSGKTVRQPSGSLFMPRADLIELPMAPKTLEEAAAQCTRDPAAKNVVTEELPGGVFFFSCEAEMAGQVLVRFTSVLPIGGKSIRCSGSEPVGSTTGIEICKSLAPAHP